MLTRCKNCGMGCLSAHTGNIADLISKVSEEVAIENAENFTRRHPHCLLTSPPEEPPRIATEALNYQKLESLTFIFAGDSVGVPSFKYL